MLLVTGGGGFVGSHLVAKLVKRGERVRVLDNFATGKRQNLAAVASWIDVIHGDLRDEAVVRRATDGARIIFHLAAQASVPRSIANPHETLDINLSGTLNLLQAAQAARCERVVFASTSAVYGDDPREKKSEDFAPRPLSPYAISKLAAEQSCTMFTRLHQLETVSLRYFNVFGPGQDPTSAYAAAIPRFLAALREDEAPVIYGDGEQTRDFIFVDDVVEANLLAACVPGIAGRVFNVAGGHAVSLNEILSMLTQLMGIERPARHESERAGDIRHSLADLSATRAELGFAPRVSITEGLRRLVAATPGSVSVSHHESGTALTCPRKLVQG